MPWPVEPIQWISEFNPDRNFDYLYAKKFQGVKIDNTCKMTWNLSKPYVKNKRIAIDIGCRDGEFTHYLFREFEHVYSFDYRKSLNFPRNVPNENVTWFITGLSDKFETVPASGGGQLDNLKSPKNKVPLTATLHTLDSFGFTNVDFIKIDTDGYEERIVKGAIETLRNNNPVLILEQGYFDNKEAMTFCIKELGYKHVATCSRGLDHILIKE